MCGIAGILGLGNRPIDCLLVKGMTDSLRHRGPDDEGYLAVSLKNNEVHHLVGPDSKVQGVRIEDFGEPVDLLLGHRRLSILDTSPLGHQPMSNKDKTMWVVYNGEIYNYLEIRKELENAGHTFRTNTDTEVLLLAYEQWGERCLDKFNGMWVFVIYDARKNILFGARDRFGVKPFYYTINQNQFTFASEIKALLKLPFIKGHISQKAVFDYLVLGLEEIEEEGFFSNIFELKPSFAFTYNLSSNVFRKWKYYTLEYTDRWERFDELNSIKYKSAIKQLLFDAVYLRLRSDVPVGSCLSGGIDSSSIVCIINQILEHDEISQVGKMQKVFTAGYECRAFDERKWAEKVVKQTKALSHLAIPTSDELLDDINDLVYTQGTPFGSTSIYAQYRVMKRANECGIKVLLDGQGGDELFSGYRGYYGAYALEMLRHFDIVTLFKEFRGSGNAAVDNRTLLAFMMKILGANILPATLKAKFFGRITGLKNLINPDFWNKYNSRLEMGRKKTKMTLNQMLYEYMAGFNLKTLLKYEDRNSMRFSIESRTPFADDINLIEYVFKIPSVYKIHNGWSKYLLREAVKGIIPEEIRTRKDKIGFATPEYLWLKEIRGQLADYITDDLNEFFDVKKFLSKDLTESNVTKMWRFINLAIWKKAYAL